MQQLSIDKARWASVIDHRSGAKGAETAQGAHFVIGKTLSMLLPRQRHQIIN
jgi:hypothetical protein